MQILHIDIMSKGWVSCLRYRLINSQKTAFITPNITQTTTKWYKAGDPIKNVPGSIHTNSICAPPGRSTVSISPVLGFVGFMAFSFCPHDTPSAPGDKRTAPHRNDPARSSVMADPEAGTTPISCGFGDNLKQSGLYSFRLSSNSR